MNKSEKSEIENSFLHIPWREKKFFLQTAKELGEATDQEILELQNFFYQIDPVFWINDFIVFDKGQRLTPYQEDILSHITSSPKHRIAVRSCHASGKCRLATDIMVLANGELVEFGSLIGREFEVIAVDKNLDRHVAKSFATDNGVKDIYKITTDKGRVINVTEEHPLWGDITPRRRVPKNNYIRLRPEASWIKAKDLIRGSVIAIALGQDGPRINDKSDDEIKFCAYLLGDGGLTSSVGFTQSDGIACDDFLDICKNLHFNVRYSDPIQYHVTNGATAMMKDWGMFGKNSWQKYFPDWVWTLDDRQLALFLSRLYACDGWGYWRVNKNVRGNPQDCREIGYCTVSERMARDVQRALLRLGVEVNLRQKKTSWTHKGVKKHSTAFCLEIHDAENCLKFIEKIGIYGKEEILETIKQSCLKADSHYTEKWRSHGLPEGYLWEKVKSIEIIKDQPTVAITVPGYETYLTEFVEHNSFTAAMLVLWFACTREAACMRGEPLMDWKVVTTAGAWRQLTKYLWPEIHKWARKIDFEKLGRKPFSPRDELMALNLKLQYGEALSAASSNSELIEGAHASQMLYVFDESKAIAESVFDSAEGALMGGKGIEAFVYCSSTPGVPAGRFYDIHTKREKFQEWWTRHVKFSEVIAAGRATEEWAEDRKRQWGADSALYNNKVLGEFKEDDDNGLIRIQWVEDAFNRWDKLDADGEIKRLLEQVDTIAIDVSDRGDDTIVVLLAGDVVVEVRAWSKVDTEKSTQRFIKILDRYKRNNVRCVIDANGMGTPIYHTLRHKGYKMLSFMSTHSGKDFTDRSKKQSFGNARGAAFYHLKEMLDPYYGSTVAFPRFDFTYEGQRQPSTENAEKLLTDLTLPHWEEKNGKIYVESKKEIRKRIGEREDGENRSTDRGDAMAMAFWARKMKIPVGVPVAGGYREQMKAFGR